MIQHGSTVDSDVVAAYIGTGQLTNSQQLDRTFGALADRTRRAIIGGLARGDATVGELARPFRVSRPAISSIPGCSNGPGSCAGHATGA